jgi:hypothetical protein
MPVATVKYFTGDISLIGDIPFGILEVEVETLNIYKTSTSNITSKS